MDIKGKDRQARYTAEAPGLLQHAVELTQEVDRVRVPAAASGIHEEIYSTSMTYLEVARITMQWVGAPVSAKKEEINTKLAQARNLKANLEKNQWVNHP